MPLLPSYSLLSEISLIRLKGSFGSLNTLTINIGYLYGLAASLIIPVHLLPLVSLIPSIIFLLLSPFLPESPVWLIRQGRAEDAKAVLQRLRGPGYDIEPEIKEIEIVAKKIEVENITPKTTIMTRAKKALMSCKKTALDRTFFLPSAIVCTLFTVQAFSG